MKTFPRGWSAASWKRASCHAQGLVSVPSTGRERILVLSSAKLLMFPSLLFFVPNQYWVIIFFFFFLDLLILFDISEYFACRYVWVLGTCLVPAQDRRGHQTPRTGVTGGCVFWKLNLAPLKERQSSWPLSLLSRLFFFFFFNLNLNFSFLR